MGSELTAGPAQLVLTATVARRYYVDGRSKVEIADELDISRFKVARLLDQALATGLVRIEIGHPGSIDTDLSSRLREQLGLRTAIVVGTEESDPAALRTLLGRAAGDLLTETVSPARRPRVRVGAGGGEHRPGPRPDGPRSPGPADRLAAA